MGSYLHLNMVKNANFRGLPRIWEFLPTLHGVIILPPSQPRFLARFLSLAIMAFIATTGKQQSNCFLSWQKNKTLFYRYPKILANPDKAYFCFQRQLIKLFVIAKQIIMCLHYVSAYCMHESALINCSFSRQWILTFDDFSGLFSLEHEKNDVA